jgi:hypothetical protein
MMVSINDPPTKQIQEIICLHVKFVLVGFGNIVTYSARLDCAGGRDTLKRDRGLGTKPILERQLLRDNGIFKDRKESRSK